MAKKKRKKRTVLLSARDRRRLQALLDADRQARERMMWAVYEHLPARYRGSVADSHS